MSATDGPSDGFGATRTVTKLPLPAGVPSNAKTLVGGLGNDHVIGGDGPAKMFGDQRIDDEALQAGSNGDVRSGRREHQRRHG